MAVAQDGHADEVTGAEYGDTGGKAHEGSVAFWKAVIQQGRIHRPKAGQGEKTDNPATNLREMGFFKSRAISQGIHDLDTVALRKAMRTFARPSVSSRE